METEKIIDLLAKLQTTTAMTRKMGYIQRLSELLDDEKTQLELDKASVGANKENTQCRSWQRIFSICHKFYQDLMQSSSSSRDTIIKADVQDAAHKLVAHVISTANRDKEQPFMDYKVTAEICIAAARREESKSSSQGLYINVIHDKLISLPGYWADLMTDHWNELVDFCVEMFANVTMMSKFKLISILDICIRIGSKQSMVVLNLKNKFVTFETMLDCAHESVSIQHFTEIILKMNISLATELSMECRFALCKLGEQLLPKLLTLTKRDLSLLLKYCLLQMALHHPNGAGKDSSAAYAHDWDSWQSTLNLVFYTVQTELRSCYATRGGIQRKQEPSVSPDLITLSAQVFKQIFSTDPGAINYTQLNNSLSSSEGPSAKKPRMALGINVLIDQLRSAKKAEEICVRLLVLSEYLKKFGYTLKSQEYFDLLQMLAETQSLSKTSTVMKYLWNCCEFLLGVVPENDVQIIEESSTKTLWSNIWDMALRSAGLNQCVESSNSLLRAMLESKHASSINTRNVLDLYLKKSIHLDAESLKTLVTLAKHCHLPSLGNSYDDGLKLQSQGTREKVPNWELVLNWLLPSKDEEEDSGIKALLLIPPHLLGEALVRFICKNRIELMSYDCLAPRKQTIEILDKIHATYSLEQKSDNLPVQPENSYQSKPQICDLGLKKLSGLLSKNSSQLSATQAARGLPTQECSSQLADSLGACVHQVMVNATVMSHLLDLQLWDSGSLRSLSIIQDTKQLLQVSIPNCFDKIIETKRDQLPMDQILMLGQLFSTNYHTTVMALIRKCTPEENLLSHIFNLCSDVSNKAKLQRLNSFYVSFVEEPAGFCPFPVRGKLTREENNMVAFTKIYASFCFNPKVPNADSVAEHSLQLLRMCHGLVLDGNASANLHRILITLQMASAASRKLNPELCLVIMDMLKLLTTKYQRDVAIVTPILSILQGMLPYLNSLDEPIILKQFAQAIVKGFKVFTVEKKRFGSEMRLVLIDCIKKWIEIDPGQKWALIRDKLAALELLDYLKDPFQEVRDAAAQCLHQVFLPDVPEWTLKEASAWRETAKNKLTEAVMQSASFLEETEAKQDEAYNFGTSALKSLSAAMMYCPNWRSEILFTIFEMQKTRNIDLNMTLQTFNKIGILLNCDMNTFLATNLENILQQWLSKHSISEFPHALLGCASEKEFLTKHKTEVTKVLMLNGDVQCLALVAGKIGLGVKDMVGMCQVSLASTCLPFIACEMEFEQGAKERLKNCHSLFCINLGEDEIENILGANMVEVICGQYEALRDEEVWSERMGEELALAPSVTITMTHDALRQTYSWIQDKLPNPDIPVLVFLTNQHPGHCQGIMQKLALKVFSPNTEEIKLLFFLQYSSLIFDLTNYLGKNRLGKISAFVVRDTVHVLLNVIKESTKVKHVALSAAVCATLLQLFKECSKSDSVHLEPILPTVVNALVLVVKKNADRPVARKALEVLHFLIVDLGAQLESVSKLEQFPPGDEFAELQAACDHIRGRLKGDHLEDEIDHFLTAGQASSGNRVEGLTRLKKQLASRKMELGNLYSELKSLDGLAKPQSSLHQLICSLVTLAKGNDEEIALEAAACLGELGPGELMTTVLIELEDPANNSDASKLFHSKKIELLQSYLEDSNRDVCLLASEALHLILRSKEGKEALETIPQAQYLFPFETDSCPKGKAIVKVNDVKFLSTLHDPEIWSPSQVCSHGSWIIKLTSSILQTVTYQKSYIEILLKLCRLKEEFAESILPPLLCFVMSNDECSDLVLQQLNNFFSVHFETRATGLVKRRSFVFCNKKSLECMLNVVYVLKLNFPSEVMSTLNFLHVAQAAQYCSAHFSCIFYAELWGLRKKIGSGGKLKSIEQVCDDSPEGIALHENLLKSYRSITDPDAIYGCGMSRLLDKNSQECYFEHCQMWGKVLLLKDLDAGASSARMLRGMAPAMMNLGLQNLLKANLDAEDDEQMRDAQLQCCWRLGQWDQPTVLDLGLRDVSFEFGRYSALKSLFANDQSGLIESLSLARRAVIKTLNQFNLESTQNIYKVLSELQMLQEIEDAVMNNTEEVLDKWKEQDLKSDYKFEYLEPILAQRYCILMGITENAEMDSMSSNGLENLQKAQAELLLTQSRRARSEKMFHVSERALNLLAKDVNISRVHRCKFMLEKANNYWDQGDAIFGKQILESLVSELKKTCTQSQSFDVADLECLLAVAMRTYGSWLVETGSENSQVIVQNYLMPAVKIFQENDDVQHLSEKVSTFRALAKFADNEYQRVVKYMNSPNYKAKVETMNETSRTMSSLGRDSKNSKDKDIRTAITVNTVQLAIDKNEIETTNAEKKEYLKLTMEYYIKCLEMSDERVSTIFRVIALWLDNKEISATLDFEDVPTYKFIPVIPQLTPHMKTARDDFQTKISSLLMNLSKDHPHHTLPNILALKFSALDHEHEKSVKPCNDTRVIEAANTIKKLATNSGLLQVIKQLEEVTKAVVELAYFSYDNAKQGTTNAIPENLRIRRLKNLTKIQVATTSLAVQKSGKYSPNGILKYDPKFSLVGGIHAPKKLLCFAMDGSKHIQLCKGLDDLHLDAVMQQVFTIVNRMFLRNASTSSRKLSLRTYNVCPLSQRSGLIEWCRDTVPIGTYLINAHPRYNDGDLTPMECRRKMQHSEGNLQNKAKRLQTFLDICSSFRPVFHNFFLEHYVQPAKWFERRLAYTRSVAASSMIGYILGLGDRHVQNILIDTSTAEVIHIDFGICFEQGLVLRMPELIPFRLSRDIEAGFGVSGTEGVFKKSCEAALQVLRDNQTTVQTILQVLLYNPMYVWTIPLSQNDNSRKGAKGVRDERSSDEANLLAERALLRLQQKLMGSEEGMANSVEGQVNRLIQKARDPQNLSLLFSGWQPYL